MHTALHHTWENRQNIDISQTFRYVTGFMASNRGFVRKYSASGEVLWTESNMLDQVNTVAIITTIIIIIIVITNITITITIITIIVITIIR